jgi:hypothetical protein
MGLFDVQEVMSPVTRRRSIPKHSSGEECSTTSNPKSQQKPDNNPRSRKSDNKQFPSISSAQEHDNQNTRNRQDGTQERPSHLINPYVPSDL